MGKTDPVGRGPCTRLQLAPSDLAGLAAVQLAVVLVFVDLRLALVPLTLFVLLCVAAPFVPTIGFFLPLICRGEKGSGTVALTFDDGPYPETTPELMALLARHGVKATFFVVGKRADANADIVRALLEAGHEIGNHTMSHDPLLMLRSRRRLREEIAGCQRVLESMGVRPLAFRPPAGITNPRLRSVLTELGLTCVTFGCRAWDGGNRKTGRIAQRILKCAGGGTIVVLHDRPPPHGNVRWLEQVDATIRGLRDRNLEPVLLSQLLRRPVM